MKIELGQAVVKANSERVKALAQEAGFAKAGIAAPVVDGETKSRFAEWLSKNFHADMHWLVENAVKRLDPKMVMPQVRSVVSLALVYNTPHKHSNEPSKGKISRYAWGKDYHLVIEEKLKKLISELQSEFPGSNWKGWVDTGPTLDKYWAAKSGIGWQGKHTNLLAKGLGSYFFLATLFTDLELERDSPVRDMCGKCTRCIEACPTQAIVEPYLLDSNRCLSYWTIEYRGPKIPDGITQNLNGWLFGCDICQEVCPYNKTPVFSSERDFLPYFSETELNLAFVAEITQAEFSTRFSKSAVKRAKRSGLVRNAKALKSLDNR
ncbi:MAG TPA: tRNA epoxyqueuosine(34) reductase QueG [candidate division Zixibacteria bacterium]|nr:tRNA epoxyqueuosine(34) reductase QueG [candidate division Zixibacteria bacterium]